MEGFEPKGFLETIQKERTTHFFGPAVVYLTCAKLLPVDTYDLSSMAMFVLGGSPISKENIFLILDTIKLRGQNKLQQVYGFTEAGPSGLGLYPEEIESKTSSSGCVVDVWIVSVTMDENGKRVEVGAVCERAVRSEGTIIGYY